MLKIGNNEYSRVTPCILVHYEGIVGAYRLSLLP
jgi:hypothetical protein